MRPLVFGALLALVPGLASAEVSVKVRGGRLDVKAAAAPLSEILGQLARQTGMKVVNDAPLPSIILTLTLEDRTPVEAVLGVLQGLGLNYALVTDYTGSRVETLVMPGAAGLAPLSSMASPISSSRARSPTQPALPPGPLEPSAVEEEPEPPEPASLPTDDSAAAGIDPAAGPGAHQPQVPQPKTYHPSTFTSPESVLPALGGQAFPTSPFAPRPPALVAPPAQAPGEPGEPPAQPGAQPTPPPQPPTN